ncbi:MAG: hypothetical protein FWG66_13230, partial [Spirochaetes bacterium]|nr:hypothetical protein [Spirochaetota bacterium]
DLPSRLVPAVLPNVDMALTFGENTVSHTAGNQSRSGTYRIVGSSIEITFDNGNEATATLGSGNEYIEFEGFRYFPR